MIRVLYLVECCVVFGILLVEYVLVVVVIAHIRQEGLPPLRRRFLHFMKKTRWGREIDFGNCLTGSHIVCKRDSSLIRNAALIHIMACK